MMTLPIQHLFSENEENSSVTLLKQHFPQCFDKNGQFLPEKMAELMPSMGVSVSREAYTLNWLGKSYARYLQNCPPTTLLNEDVAHNALTQNQHSQNLLIKGDNLEVLKHLKNAYDNQVKMIYIDPPYNTGSDGFVYQDDRKFSPEQLASLANMSVEEATRVLSFTAKKSNSHSAWLTFMYPRLYIARELLRDDGVIFISIDDNEQAQLKLLCDEVFGEENFVAEFIHVGNSSKNKAINMSIFHEYSIIYAKNKSNLNFNQISKNNSDEFILRAKKLFKDKSNDVAKELRELTKYPRFYDFDHYTLVDNKGVFRANDLTAIGSKNFFDILHPITGKACKTGTRGWAYSKNGIQELLEKNLIYFGKDETTIPQLKGYLEDNLLQTSKSVAFFDAQVDTKKLKKDGIRFEFTKPVALIQYFLSIGANQNDLILDFFAGSGTTAHAVMQLNAEDGGNRKFICVQLPEETDKKSEAYKAGYQTIFDITKARIEKAVAKIQQDFPDFNGNLGFKIFETVPDFRAFDGELSPQFELPDTFDAALTDEQYHILLTTWRVFDGNALTEPVQAVALGGFFAKLSGKVLYILHAGFDSSAIKALMEKLDNDNDFQPERIVLFGANVESAKQKELKQALESYTNRKKLEIPLLVRY